MTDLSSYVDDAIRRIQVGEVTGSHATGVFNKAANGFEKVFRQYFQTVTGRAPGVLTLGQLINELENRLGAPSAQLAAILVDAKVVNKPWREVKHGADPPVRDLLAGLIAMQRVIPQL
jgi:hypothetical protein